MRAFEYLFSGFVDKQRADVWADSQARQSLTNVADKVVVALHIRFGQHQTHELVVITGWPARLSAQSDCAPVDDAVDITFILATEGCSLARAQKDDDLR